MRSNWTVGRKLGVTFAVVITLLLAVALSSLSAIGKLESVIELTAVKSARKVELAGIINTSESDMAAAERQMIVETAAKHSDGVDAAERTFQEDVIALQKAAGELRDLAKLAETRDLLNRIDRQAADWKTNLTQVAALLRAGNIDEASKLSKAKDDPLYQNIGRDADRITTIQNHLTAQDLSEAQSVGQTSRWTSIGLTLVAILVGVGVLLVIRSVNLTLRGLAARLFEGAAQVSAAAGQVSATGQAFAQGSSEQAASLEETSASGEEIAAMSLRNSEHSEEAARLVTSTGKSVEGANQRMEEMIHSMTEITASSSKISKIIKVIDEIAFQTNILALNAAVEAARAGVAGMGFAVVADEVRNLAQRSAQAARDTAELIEESIHRSNDGSSRLASVSAAILEITDQSSKVRVLVDEINTSSREQSRGIEQVAGAISQMQQVNQANAASAEETAAAGKELAGQAQTLNELVGALNLLVGKSGSGTGQLKSRQDAEPRLGSGLHALNNAVISRSLPSTKPKRTTESAEELFPLEPMHK